MDRMAIIDKLNQTINAKRKELGLNDEDTEKYRWLIRILKMKSEGNKSHATPNHQIKSPKSPFHTPKSQTQISPKK